MRLKNLPGGGPYTLTLKGDRELAFHNIMVGEVWVCSGQSNMERQLGPRPPQKPIFNWEQEVAAANYPAIRQFLVGRKTPAQPATEVEGKWVVCSPATVATFTAVGYFFGRDIHLARKVPVGLIHTSWGGTCAEAWTRHEVMEQDPLLRPNLDKRDATIRPIRHNWPNTAPKNRNCWRPIKPRSRNPRRIDTGRPPNRRRRAIRAGRTPPPPSTMA